MTQIDPMNKKQAAADLLQDNILLGLGNLWDLTKVALRKPFVSIFSIHIFEKWNIGVTTLVS